MSMILMLTDRLGALDTRKLVGIGAIGVSSVTLLEDETTTGVLVQGWAFDPTSAMQGVLDALVDGGHGVRVLRPVMQVSVSQTAAVTNAVVRASDLADDEEGL